MSSTVEKYKKVIKEKFSQAEIMVIGDLMVDEYVLGNVTRISPEAPIPILNYKQQKRIAGGASNVAFNMASLGSKVMVAGVLGNDDAGEWLKGHMKKYGINVEGIVGENERPTTVKRRFATKNQQLLRVDIEETQAIYADTEKKIINVLQNSIGNLKAVVLSDYQKGMFTNSKFVRELISICRKNDVIITIDSKSNDIEAFEGATFVKPNNLELEKAVGIKIVDEKTLDEAGECYLRRSGAKALMVTRGAMGISLFMDGSKRKDFPSKAVQVYDVTGAGDTVISTVTLGMAAGLSLEEAIVLGNIAAGIVISKVGTAPVESKELLEMIYEK